MSPEGSIAEKAADKTFFGFWLYLMTDFMLFASLFATYIVLRNSTNGGASGAELFDMPFVLLETIVLLTSSFLCGLMLYANQKNRLGMTRFLLASVLGLGLVFLGMEISEFVALANEGHSWGASAFMSAFFTLVGTHGAHIVIGCIWALTLLWRLGRMHRMQDAARATHQLVLFALFWHFLDLVWIFIFSIVYLMGVAA